MSKIPRRNFFLLVACLIALAAESGVILGRWREVRQGRAVAAQAMARPGRKAAAAAHRSPPAGSAALARALADPAFLRPLALLQRQMITRSYRRLFDDLKLDPASRRRLTELLAKKQLIKTDAENAAYDQGLYGTGAVIPAIAAAQKDVNGEIEQLLGPQGFEDYYNFEMTNGIRATLERLQDALRYTSEPIADSAVERMIGVLDQATPAGQRGGIAKFTGADAATAAGLNTQEFSAALPKNAPALLGSTLSPSQLGQLNALMAQQRDELRLRSLRAASMGSPADSSN